MRSLFGNLCLMFGTMFWIFRIVVTLLATLGVKFFCVPLDFHVEIVLLFATLVFLLLVGKRKVIGGICYFLAYAAYFGVDIYHNVVTIINGAALDPNQAMAVLISFIGIILPTLTLMELLFDQNRKKNPTNKKTDWFYKNEQFDRKMDDRADKNNYRIY